MNKELIDALRQAVKEEVSAIKKEASGIKEEISGIKAEVSELNKEINPIKQKLNKMDEKLDRIEKRVNATFKQTAGLSEFRTEANNKLDNISEEIHNIHSDVSLANVTASKNRIDIEMIKNIINK